MTPTFQGEVQFRRYSDTSTQGQQLVFAVHGREELEAFIGKEGKRFMAVLVEIGDDEMPVKPIAKAKEREHLGDLCYRAVMLCNDSEFRRWLTKKGDFAKSLTASAARAVICDWCGITSRKDLDANPAAKEYFVEHILGPWQKYQIARRSA